jgi:hypothetical protein
MLVITDGSLSAFWHSVRSDAFANRMPLILVETNVIAGGPHGHLGTIIQILQFND